MRERMGAISSCCAKDLHGGLVVSIVPSATRLRYRTDASDSVPSSSDKPNKMVLHCSSLYEKVRT